MSVKINHHIIRLTLLIILFTLLYMIYQYWPLLIFKGQLWQKTLHQQLTHLLINVKQHKNSAGMMLIGLSFLYGILHSAGPGHGKMIISTYLTTQPTYYRQALVITVLSALLQGLVAIILVILAISLFSLTRHELGLSELWLTRLSYSFILILGISICLRTLYRQYRQSTKSKLQFKYIRPLPLNISSPVSLSRPMTISPLITNDAACDCHHLPSATELQQANSLWSRFTMLLAIGIRPCSGAVLVLIFAKILTIFEWGILAVFAMSLGTALTISLIAVLVLIFRQMALRLIQVNQQSNRWIHNIGWLLRFMGGVILILFGLFLLLSTPTFNPILFSDITH